MSLGGTRLSLLPRQGPSPNPSGSLPLTISECSLLVSLKDGIRSATRPLSSAGRTS